MMLSRRQALALAQGAAALAAFGGARALAAAPDAQAAIEAFTGGATPTEGAILTAPEIAENGNSVPVSIAVPSDMTEQSYVQSVLLIADGNPNPKVVTFHFSPLSGQANATTRIRLARTQNLIAVAKMNDGSVMMDRREVKVTIGGCGG